MHTLAHPPLQHATDVGSIAFNARYRAHRVAGQQRYANELSARLAGFLDVLAPDKPLKGWQGHAWEQIALPRSAGPRLLWSPCQAGPVFHKRHVVTFHDLFALENPEWFSKPYVLWYRTAMPMLARKAVKLISVSHFTKSRLVNLLGIPEEKVTVVHSGIAGSFHAASEVAIQCASVMLGLPSRNYVLSVSSLEPRKNLPRLLEAWKKALPSLPEDCWLILAGAAGNSGVFSQEHLDATASRVYYTGYVDEALLPALYSGACAFAYPSLAEGFGLPVLEAMACGVPSLTANTSSLPEVTGDAAVLVNPLDIDAIAKGLIDIVTSREMQQTLRVRGTRQAARFQWEQTADQTLNALHEAASSVHPELRA